VSVLGRYVHNPSQKLWLAYHRIAKYLIRTKDFRLIFGTHDPLRRTEPYVFTDSDWAADLEKRKSTGPPISKTKSTGPPISARTCFFWMASPAVGKSS